MTNESQKYLAMGLMWLLILTGIGSCSYLASRGQGDNDKPFIYVHTVYEAKK